MALCSTEVSPLPTTRSLKTVALILQIFADLELATFLHLPFQCIIVKGRIWPVRPHGPCTDSHRMQECGRMCIALGLLVLLTDQKKNASSEAKHLFQIIIYVVSFLLPDMDLKDPATLASISNSMIRSPVPRPLKTLYRGEPMALGFIISGSLSVAAAKDPKVPLVKGMLAMNVVSSVAAGIAIVIFSISLEHIYYFYYRCTSYYLSTMPPDICHEYITIPQNLMHAISAVLLTVTVLEFLISITTAAFGCATMCRNAYSETTVVIFQKTDEGITPASALPRQMYENVEA
ncbi:membrane-spanning 4-domains subfamily A member 4A-like isoform X2 [Sphaerodactylus townsendi]|uniref:membrane-spanning 4-domains subfamily A member 4A-like isoform X2 n=1 Tax=Sphaerodactylus townsendi TaxID=933632 RepID=UPI002025D963|nr:membrane-spanning 4-domains subfamily A member 4A-like isoform X2 [Sphaerodactylus townsendi]